MTSWAAAAESEWRQASDGKRRGRAAGAGSRPGCLAWRSLKSKLTRPREPCLLALPYVASSSGSKQPTPSHTRLASPSLPAPSLSPSVRFLPPRTRTMADAVTDQLAQASLEIDPTKLGPLSHEVISKQATSASSCLVPQSLRSCFWPIADLSTTVLDCFSQSTSVRPPRGVVRAAAKLLLRPRSLDLRSSLTSRLAPLPTDRYDRPRRPRQVDGRQGHLGCLDGPLQERARA